ncbi:MAG: SCP2 sterol-binding domain-containing protein [Pseudomonadota bacterium]
MTEATSLTALTDRVRSLFGQQSPLGHTLTLDLGETGRIFVDGTGSGTGADSVVDNRETLAACTITLSAETLAGLLDGTVDGGSAFMNGQIKVAGDFQVALILAGMLSD